MIDHGRWQVPNTWQWAAATEFADVVGGGTPREATRDSNFAENGVPWITPADLSGYNKSRISRGARNLSVEGFSNSSARMVPEGTVLLTSRAPVGYCVVAANELCTNQGFKSFVVNKSLISPDYLRHYLIGSRQYLESNASGTTFLELSANRASQLLFPIAPTGEQHRIASRIDQLFSRIDDGERSLAQARALLERYRQSVLKAAVTGELTRDWREQHKGQFESGEALLKSIHAARRESWERAELARMKANGRQPTHDSWNTRYQEPGTPDVENLPELADGWAWVSMSAITEEFITGPFGSALHKDDYVSGGIPLVNPTNIRDGTIVPDNSVTVSPATLKRLRRYRLAVGDIILARRGEMGRCAAVKANQAGWLCGTGSAILRCTSAVLSEFAALAISSGYSRRFLEDNCVGTTMHNLNQDAISRLPIPLPSLEEQPRVLSAIASRMENAKQMIEILGNGTRRSAALRQSILHSAFTGRLVPQDPNDEPASVLLEKTAAERPAWVKPAPARVRTKKARKK